MTAPVHQTDNSHGKTDHGLSDVGRKLGEHGRVVVVGNGLDDGTGALDGVTGQD